MPGKINASLNRKLDSIEWGEYRLGDLFDIVSTLSFNADSLVDGYEYDYVTRTSINQGVFRSTGFVNEENINDSGVWSLGLLQMDFFYRKRKWYAGQFVRKIIPKIDLPPITIPFFSAVLNHKKSILLSVLVRNVDETFRELKVKLPSRNGKIDFGFIEAFIAEIEAEHMSDLASYLKISGLDDYVLTKDEQAFVCNVGENLSEIKAMLDDRLKNIEWNEYRIGDLFSKIVTKKLPYKANDLPNKATGQYVLPCLTSSFRNQGLNYYVPKEGATVLKNVISIPSNSDVYRAYFQPIEFTVLSDSYAICWKSEDIIVSPNQYLFMMLCINKVTDLPIYSYKNKLGGWNVVKNKKILLPQTNGKIDFVFMETFVRIMKKLLIKDVVLYAEKK